MGLTIITPKPAIYSPLDPCLIIAAGYSIADQWILILQFQNTIAQRGRGDSSIYMKCLDGEIKLFFFSSNPLVEWEKKDSSMGCLFSMQDDQCN